MIKIQMLKQNTNLSLGENVFFYSFGYLKGVSHMRTFIPSKNEKDIVNIHIVHMQIEKHIRHILCKN